MDRTKSVSPKVTVAQYASSLKVMQLQVEIASLGFLFIKMIQFFL